MTSKRMVRLITGAVCLLGIMGSVWGQPTVRVARSYEDTVRIAVLWNAPTGMCNDQNTAYPTYPVGERTRDTVLKAISTVNQANIRVLRTDATNWTTIRNLWPGRLPHTIVHVNAGWVTYGVAPPTNTLPPNPVYNTLETLFDSAVTNKIGLVSIGDDAAFLASRTFGFTGVNNVPQPMGDATHIRDSLWIKLLRANDNNLKTWDDRNPTVLRYPYVNGVISNAIDSILRRDTLFFKPYQQGRCQADADRYSVAYPEKITFLGYQQGRSGGVLYGNPNELNVIAAIQDTTMGPMGPVIRRGVSLSFQPQFLRHTLAEQQIIYDAIMFSSLAHTLDIPTRMIIVARGDTITAGDTLPLRSYVINQFGDTIFDPNVLSRISWSMDPVYQRPGDRLLNPAGSTVNFTATVAHRAAYVTAALTLSTGFIVDTTVRIWVRPAAVDHLVIEQASNPLVVSPNADNPLGGVTKTITIGPAQTEARGYAVLRDRFQNYISFSTNTTWGTPQTTLITARSGTVSIGEGIITKLGPAGTARVGARDNPSTRTDSVTVIISTTTYDSLRIMQFNTQTGQLVRINSLTLARGQTTTLYVQGLRTDRLGPNGGWENVNGNWSITANLNTSVLPPQNQNAWTFSPLDTGTGRITVALTSGPSTWIPVTFTAGAPNSIAIYPQAGAPVAPNNAWPSEPRIADTVTAGVEYVRLYAKLFDGTIWLRQYEDSARLANQIAWTVTPLDETTLSAANGNHTRLTTTRAFRAVRVTATWNNLSYSILLWVKAGAVARLVIEASADIQNFVDAQPLSQLVIPADQVAVSAYAILRDAYGNYVGYSTITNWRSTDTTIFRADTGLQSVGEGIAFRRADSGNALMIATNTTARPGTTLIDTVPVVLSNVYYTKLRIYTINPLTYPDTVRIRTDEALTLYVEGLRSDGRGWDNVPAAWAKTASLATRTQPPSWLDRWNVIPDSVGTGWIKASRPDGGSDSVFAIFLPGMASQIALYRREGNPAGQFRFPTIDTIAAGSIDTIVAKIFDRNGQWLSQYENINVSRTLISWTIQKLSGPGGSDTLGIKAGHLATFAPRIAYCMYRVTATFAEGTTLLSASAQIYVRPGAAHHLVIEENANIIGDRLIRDYPLDTLRFGSRDTVLNAFAIIRDRQGNYVDYSTTTRWTSLNQTIVTAAEGAALVGEGRVFRVGTLGQTKVIAVNRTNPNLFDTVDVVLSNFSFDALRITVRDTVDITSLVMRSDQDTLLHVQGKRSFDGVWVDVSANWNYIATLSPLSATGIHEWRFNPIDTGRGVIIVTLGSAIPDTVTVTILPGLPSKLVLYPKEGPPDAGNTPLPDPSQPIPVTAGTAFLMVAKVFDWRGVYIDEYELQASRSGLISWNAANRVGTILNAQLQRTTGAVNRFTPTRAYDSVFVVAKLDYDPTHQYLDTVQLAILPGAAAKIVLEKNPTYDRNRANPCDTLYIPSDRQSGSVFAIVRDAFDNFIRYADVSSWGSLDTSTVAVQKGNTTIGEGVAIRKAQTDTTQIFAVETNGLRDSCHVALLAYYYKALRIVLGNDTNPTRLTMNNNQDTTVRVQGLRSDTAVWVDLSARWELSTSLQNVVPGHGTTKNNFIISPTDTGQGWIRVTLGNDSLTTPDTLPIVITPGGPWRVEFVILTPQNQRIAGALLTGITRIYDRDGNLVRGTFNIDTATYHDTLGRGGMTRPRPFMIVGSDTVWLDAQPWDAARQTFVSGIDTVSFRLYYAPYYTNNGRDSLHQIYLNLQVNGQTLRTSSEPFLLLPGPLSALLLEYPNGTRVADTVRLNYPQGSLNVVSFGYDAYGNRISPIGTNWSTTNTLHPVTPSQNVVSIFYTTSTVRTSESGYIITVKDSAGIKVSDSVFVIIRGPAIGLVQAITGDVSGNGNLDRMTLIFSRAVTLPAGFTFDSLVVRYRPGTSGNWHIFKVDSVLRNTGRSDSIWVVALRDSVSTLYPGGQTGWTPQVIIPAMPSVEIEGGTITSIDGAGPVIMSVVKQLDNKNRRDHDIVTVTFSEPVQGANGNKAAGSLSPAQSFRVWRIDPDHPNDSTRFVDLPEMLKVPSAITSFNSFNPDNTVAIFTMTNGNDLNRNHWVNLDSVTKYLVDQSPRNNKPNDNNQKVQVRVTGNPEGPVIIIPNPFRPTLSIPGEGPGVLNIIHNPNARDWARTIGGTVISFDVRIPTHPEVDINCAVRIHDVAGNVVQSGHGVLFGTTSRKNVDSLDMAKVDIFWNGTNDKGMVVAPGVYRVVVYISYKARGSAKRDDVPLPQKKIANLGIMR